MYVRYVIGYLLRRVMTGRNCVIEYMMQVPGHAQCLVDSGFTSIKKLFRHSDCNVLDWLEAAFILLSVIIYQRRLSLSGPAVARLAGIPSISLNGIHIYNNMWSNIDNGPIRNLQSWSFITVQGQFLSNSLNYIVRWQSGPENTKEILFH